MAGIINFSIDLSKVNKEKLKDGKYLNGTMKVNDEVNDYGQNAQIFHAQTKEERANESVKKEYFGNGKVVWTDGSMHKAPWKDSVSNTQQNQNRTESFDDIFA